MPRVEPAAPTRLPTAPVGASFPASGPSPGLESFGRQLQALGAALLERQGRLDRDNAILQTQEATIGLEQQVLSDPAVSRADAPKVFSERLQERQDQILEKTGFLGRQEASRALRASAAARTARVTQLAFQLQQQELLRTFEAKNQIRLRRFANSETPEQRDLVLSALRVESANLVERKILTAAEATAETRLFEDRANEATVDRLIAQGRFDEARLHVADAPLGDAQKAALGKRIDQGEDSDLIRQDRVLAHQDRLIEHRQLQNFQGFYARLADEDTANDPTDVELNRAVSQGSLTPTQVNLIQEARDDSSGPGSGSDAAFLDLSLDAARGLITPETAASRANGLSATREQKLGIVRTAVAAQAGGPLARSDIQGALAQLDTFFPDRNTLSILGTETAATFTGAQRAATEEIAATISNAAPGSLTSNDIQQIVRTAVVRNIPNAGVLPAVLPANLQGLVSARRDPTGNPVIFDRPQALSDVPLFEHALDTAELEGLLSPDEAQRRREELDIYRRIFLLRDLSESLGNPPPEIPTPKPAPSVEGTTSALPALIRALPGGAALDKLLRTPGGATGALPNAENLTESERLLRSLQPDQQIEFP